MFVFSCDLTAETQGGIFLCIRRCWSRTGSWCCPLGLGTCQAGGTQSGDGSKGLNTSPHSESLAGAGMAAAWLLQA